MVLRPVVQVQQPLAHLWVAQLVRLPPVAQTVHDEVAGHLRGGEVEAQLLLVGQKDPERGKFSPRLEVVVSPPGATATLATPAERADQDGGFGVDGHTEGILRAGRTLVSFRQVLKDSIRLLHFSLESAFVDGAEAEAEPVRADPVAVCRGYWP